MMEPCALVLRSVETTPVSARLVEVALARVVLPETVRVEARFAAPPTLRTLLIVEEPVTPERAIHAFAARGVVLCVVDERQELAALPGRIELLDAELADLHEKMSTPDFFKSAPEEIRRLNERAAQIPHELEAAYALWQELEQVQGKARAQELERVQGQVQGQESARAQGWRLPLCPHTRQRCSRWPHLDR